MHPTFGDYQKENTAIKGLPNKGLSSEQETHEPHCLLNRSSHQLKEFIHLRCDSERFQKFIMLEF